MNRGQFRGAIETLRVLPLRLPQLLQRSPLEVEQPREWRPAVLEQLGVDVGPLPAGSTGRKDHMPRAQVLEPNGIARRYVPFLFHSTTAMSKGTDEQQRRVGYPVLR
jgi:hypothetical protein